MKKWLICIVAILCLSSTPQAQAIDTGHRIIFTLQINTPADGRSSYEDGYGIWASYQRDLLPLLSFGLEAGVHQFTICRCGTGTGEDSLTTVPVLLVANLHFTVEDILTVFAQAGIGGSFNFISGDTADTFNVKIDPSFALDLRADAVLQLMSNLGAGVSFDCLITQANLNANSSVIADSINLGHYGAGIVVIISF